MADWRYDRHDRPHLLAFYRQLRCLRSNGLGRFRSVCYRTIILVIMLVASIPGGVITDRSDRRRLIYLYSIFASVVSAGIFLYVLTGHLTYLSFVVLMSILALVHGFFGEATNAALRSIVSGTGFVKAQAANQGRDAAVHLAGRPLSGLFYGFFRGLPYLISTVFLAVQGFAFSRIERSLVPRVDEKKNSRCTGN